jgi:hypothetical protein
MLIANKDLQVADHTEFLPNTIFSTNGPSVQAIIDLGFYPVTVWLPHIHDTQKLVPAQPYLIDGVCFTVAVEEKTPEDIESDLNSLALKVRAERNRKLSETDWTQLSDSTADKEAWANYRRALRDVPTQEGFPRQVDWPSYPG